MNNDITRSATTAVAADVATSTGGACEICGWVAAACSALAFGTFAVPIKSDVARSVNIDPMVFQSYKTIMCFITAWFILFVPNHHVFVFSPWGIVSGLFWVPSGIATIYAVKTIGLALGIGISSSLIVLVSFIWGIFIFKEPIHSQFGACIAILLMILGLFGMSYHSAPTTTFAETVLHTDGSICTATYNEVCRTVDSDDDDEDNDDQVEHIHTHLSYSDDKSDVERSMQHVVHRSTSNNHQQRVQSSDSTVGTISLDDEHFPTQQLHHQRAVLHQRSYQIKHQPNFLQGHQQSVHPKCLPHFQPRHQPNARRKRPQRCPPSFLIHVWGQHKISKRYLGIASAAFCGLYGGSVMAPMKYSTADAKGTHYLLSFAIGSAIVNVVLWIFRYFYFVFYYQSWSDAYYQLPSFHLQKMWLVGSTSGIIWSIGNFFSLISVYYLGEGVGYPLVQTSILISGLWGIFYFKEIQGSDRITKWLLSSLMTVCGILLLSFEHHTK